MSTSRLTELKTPMDKDQKEVELKSIPLIIHHIWFSTPLPKRIVRDGDEEGRDRGDIFEKLKIVILQPFSGH